MENRRVMRMLGLSAAAVMVVAPLSAPAVDILNVSGTLLLADAFNNNPTMGPAKLADGNHTTSWYAYNGRYWVAVIAPQIYNVTDYVYVDNVQNGDSQIRFRYGSVNTGNIADTSVGSSTPGAAIPMTGTLSGRGGIFALGVTLASSGTAGGATLVINGTAAGGQRLPNPTIIGGTAAGWAQYPQSAATDLVWTTSYAVNGSSFYLDLDFGAATNIGFVNVIGRVTTEPTSGSLIFSDNTTFGDAGDVTVALTWSSILGTCDLEALGKKGGLTKRYVRLSGAGPANTGIQDMAFYGGLPSTLTGTLITIR